MLQLLTWHHCIPGHPSQDQDSGCDTSSQPSNPRESSLSTNGKWNRTSSTSKVVNLAIFRPFSRCIVGHCYFGCRRGGCQRRRWHTIPPRHRRQSPRGRRLAGGPRCRFAAPSPQRRATGAPCRGGCRWDCRRAAGPRVPRLAALAPFPAPYPSPAAPLSTVGRRCRAARAGPGACGHAAPPPPGLLSAVAAA